MSSKKSLHVSYKIMTLFRKISDKITGLFEKVVTDWIMYPNVRKPKLQTEYAQNYFLKNKNFSKPDTSLYVFKLNPTGIFKKVKILDAHAICR